MPRHFEIMVKRRAGKWNQVIEGGEEQIFLFGEPNTLIKTFRRIMGVAEYECPISKNTRPPQAIQRSPVIVHFIDAFAHRSEILRIEGLETDQQPHASAACHLPDQRFVLQGVQAALADPLDSKGRDGFEEFAGAGRVADDIIIHEKDIFVVNMAQFFHDFLLGRRR